MSSREELLEHGKRLLHQSKLNHTSINSSLSSSFATNSTPSVVAPQPLVLDQPRDLTLSSSSSLPSVHRLPSPSLLPSALPLPNPVTVPTAPGVLGLDLSPRVSALESENNQLKSLLSHEKLRNEQLTADIEHLRAQMIIMQHNFDQVKSESESLYQNEHAVVAKAREEIVALENRVAQAEAARQAAEQQCSAIQEDSAQLQTTLKLQGEKKAEFLLQMDGLLDERNKSLDQLRRTHEATLEELRVLQEQHSLLERAHTQTEQLLREKHELVQMLRESTEKKSSRGSEKMRVLIEDQRQVIEQLSQRIAHFETLRTLGPDLLALRKEAAEGFDRFRTQLGSLHHHVARKLSTLEELRSYRLEVPLPTTSDQGNEVVPPSDLAKLMELNQLQENRIFQLLDDLQIAEETSLEWQQQGETLRNKLGEALEANDELVSECKRLSDELTLERERIRQFTANNSSYFSWFSRSKSPHSVEQPI